MKSLIASAALVAAAACHPSDTTDRAPQSGAVARIVDSPRFRALAGLGARSQRVLWASTSTKDPSYPDVYYVDALVGEHTIDTMPLTTFDAYRDHGRPSPRLEQDVDRARAVLRELADVGIDLDAVTQRLEQEGVRKFTDSYDRLLAALDQRRATAIAEAGEPAHA